MHHAKDITLANLINELQYKGYSYVDNFFPKNTMDKIKREYQQLENESMKQLKPNQDTIVLKPTQEHIAMNMALDYFTKGLMAEFNEAFSEYDETIKTSYYHPPQTFETFKGYMGTQLRMRVSGALDKHIDRSSARLTVLYYLNTCEGGDLRLWLLPKEKTNTFKAANEWHLQTVSHSTEIVDIAAKENRLIVFWSDCIPHEVLTTLSPRSCLQVFYASEAHVDTVWDAPRKKSSQAKTLRPFILSIVVLLLCILIYFLFLK